MKTIKPGRKTKYFLLIAIVVFAGMQLVRPHIERSDNAIVTGLPENVEAILRRSCYDCHSGQPDLKWFDQVTPANWLVADHIRKGKAGLNFSAWSTMSKADQNGKLWESVNQILQGAMPLSSYTALHPSAKLTAEDIGILKAYVSTLAYKQKIDTARSAEWQQQYEHWLHTVRTVSDTALPVALNGIAYMPDYKNWTPISSTQRLDNGTMRIIYGNNVAIKAIQEHHTNPWPSGTIMAKVAWDQLLQENGEITTGAFRQVEYMIKDEVKYASTAGWGWARFKTPKMVPYGKTAAFTTECVSCHRPMKDNDFVFTSPIQ
ncbi:MAG: heme-binding domain-containing protein [Filimonas sp.]|nr:heme-binding domain-containing protein [Filimonas sp.]